MWRKAEPEELRFTPAERVKHRPAGTRPSRAFKKSERRRLTRAKLAL